jgi:hypothetical protein
MFEYNLEHLLSFTVKVAELEVIGPVAEGLRVNGYITGAKSPVQEYRETSARLVAIG